jgi:hypothetical protein
LNEASQENDEFKFQAPEVDSDSDQEGCPRRKKGDLSFITYPRNNCKDSHDSLQIEFLGVSANHSDNDAHKIIIIGIPSFLSFVCVLDFQICVFVNPTCII